MLTSLKLHNFKCFEDLELSLCNLNVFTGMNGSGKINDPSEPAFARTVC